MKVTPPSHTRWQARKISQMETRKQVHTSVLSPLKPFSQIKIRGPLTLRAALCPPVAARAAPSTAETTGRLVPVDAVLSIVHNPKWPKAAPFPCPTAPLLLPAPTCLLIVLGKHTLPRQTLQRAGLTRNPHEVRLHLFYLSQSALFHFPL